MHRGFGPWPALLLAVMIGQRLVELHISSKHSRWIRAQGGREYGAAHFPYMVAVHALFPVLFVVEITRRQTGVAALWPLWLALLAAATALRYAAIAALGKRWTARVFVIPGLAPVRTGPYRRLAHPNYVAVMVEFVAAPMLFGAWRTALVIGVLNAAVLAVRIRCENGALQRAAVDSSR